MRNFTLLFTMFLFLSSSVMFAQNKKITGTVTSAEDGGTLPGVTVVAKGFAGVGTITDFNGKYSLDVPIGATILSFSFVGMTDLEVSITGSVVDAIMKSEDVGIEEVVVVGYGVQKKRDVTGSIAQVKGDEISSLAAPSFEGQLAGRATGVQITTQSGVLGETPRVRIRGIGSISSGTYPLVVVDGVPIFTGDLGGYASNNAMGDINPADIESVEILKDGSATAIYGSRAANGVILITTKKGSKGKFQLTYNNYLGVAQPVRLFDLLNAAESIEINNEKRTNAGQSAIAETLTTNPKVDEDWQNAVLKKNAFQQDHNLSLSGQNDLTNYYFSVGYTSQEGVSIPNEMDRFTFRSNLEQKIKKWFTVGANIGVTRSEYFGMNTGENSLSGNIFSAIRQLPNTPIYNANHPTGFNIDLLSPALVGRWNNGTTIGDNLPNIVYTLLNNKQKTKVNRSLASAFAQVGIFKGLTYKMQLSVDATGTEGYLYWNPLHGDGRGSNGRIQNNYTDLTRWNVQNILSFNKTFGEVHNLSAVLVSEVQKQRISSFYSAGTDLSNSFFQHNIITASFGTQLSGGSLAENGFISYAGRINYNFASRYFIQASMRYDGLSSMPAASKYGTFPGVSIGWNVADEAFMDAVDFISEFKLRGSYAQVGNVSVGDYPYAGLYGAAKYGDNNGIAFAQMGNNDLQWETSARYGVGLDAAFMSGKFRLTYDYFQNNQDRLILNMPTPPSFGVPGNSYKKNIGAMLNSGHELSVEANLISNNDFTLSADANISFVENEITALFGEQKELFFDTYTIVRIGLPINSIYGFDYFGVNSANGNPIYRKADGTLVQGNIATQLYRAYDPNNKADVSVPATLTNADKKVFGSSLPTYFGAFNIRSTFKGFDLALMFRFSGGNYIMNRTRDDLNQQNFTNNGAEILGRWKSESEPGDGWTPRLYAQQGNFINFSGQTNGRFVEKGDFFKFQNFVLGYTLPKSVVKKAGFERVRIFAQGQELLLLTGYTGIDPEMERGGVDFNITPRQRTITFGVNVVL